MSAHNHNSNTGVRDPQTNDAPQGKVNDATSDLTPVNLATESLVVKVRNAFEVCVCAKALQIDQVMMSAQMRVMMRVSAIFASANPLTGFPDVLSFVFESTKSGQDGLREKITSICLEKHHQCSNNAAVAAVLDEHEASLWRIAVPLLRQAAADRDASLPAQVSSALTTQDPQPTSFLATNHRVYSAVTNPRPLTVLLLADQQVLALAALRPRCLCLGSPLLVHGLQGTILKLITISQAPSPGPRSLLSPPRPRKQRPSQLRVLRKESMVARAATNSLESR